MNVTPKSSKDDVITAACELVDTQESVIKTLTGEKNTLVFLLSALLIISLIFWSVKADREVQVLPQDLPPLTLIDCESGAVFIQSASTYSTSAFVNHATYAKPSS